MDHAENQEMRYCEKCKKLVKCEEVPFMGYSEWVCKSCYRALLYSGEIV